MTNNTTTTIHLNGGLSKRVQDLLKADYSGLNLAINATDDVNHTTITIENISEWDKIGLLRKLHSVYPVEVEEETTKTTG
jgi:hypothetical protein